MEWCPYGGDPEVDYSGEPHTLVEFILEPAGSGTRLTIRESGFDRIPEDKRQDAFVGNTEGWNIQAENIAKHVEG
jgi:uncharacterized protein YndB with AHSA1/START domain